MAGSKTELTEEEEMIDLDLTEEDLEAEDTLTEVEGAMFPLESAETSSTLENASLETNADSNTRKVDLAAVAKVTEAAEASTEDPRSLSQLNSKVLRLLLVNLYRFWSTTSE